MTSKLKPIGPYAAPMVGSVLETATILGQLLRPEGYTREVISDLSIGEFLAHEHASIAEPSSMHLLALKKALLYIIPIISPPGIFEGIALTSQVSSPAIQYNGTKKQATPAALAIGDKYRLIGLAFPLTWKIHLSRDIFPWEHQVPLNYKSIAVNLEAIDGIRKITSSAYLIEPEHYEDTALFNKLNKILILCLDHALVETTSIMASLSVQHPKKRLPNIKKLTPFNDLDYLSRLNEVLPCLITPIYTMSEYECLQMSSNWRLYDEIKLFGIDSPSVSDRLSHLKYIKEETLRALMNLKVYQYQRMIQTRGEKIARERYPYYFDYTDRRSLFVGFSRFSIDKLPDEERKELSILVEKEVKAQNALLTNQCEHIAHMQHLNAMRRSGTDEETITAFRLVEPYINSEEEDASMHLCKLCSYPLICEHEIEFYTALQSVDFSVETVDKAYLVRQRIINKYKQTNNLRSGTEDTETAFTYYCKFCSGELGKSDDVIQAGVRTRDQSAFAEETNPIDSSIFSGIAHIVKFNMNQTIVPSTQRAITKLIFSETKTDIRGHIQRANKLENEFLDLFIRYVAYVYACSSLIAIKVKLKTSEKILINRDTARSGGDASDIKADFVTAYKIIQANMAFKRVGVTEVKAKALLIHAFKSMNRAFANASLPLKPSTGLDRLRNDILSSPITKYATYMYRRHHNEQQVDPLKIVGVELVHRKKSEQPSTGLFSKIYRPPKKDKQSDGDKYIEESYQGLVYTVVDAPLSTTVTPPVSEFVKSFEQARWSSLYKLRLSPSLNLPCENGRDFDFRLSIYQIGYCLDPARPHRWNISKKGQSFVHVCRLCNLDKTKVSTNASTVKSNNREIQQSLDEQMIMDAFFELYTLSCPVKNAHEYDNGICTQCGVRKEQLSSMDPAYYKQHSATYLEFRRRITNEMLRSADDITATKTSEEPIRSNSETTDVDHTKLESLGTSLSKVFGHTDMNTLGTNSEGLRVLETVESYVRLLYSHYSFAKNLSADTTSHPDANFYLLAKELSSNFAPLPPYPESGNADQLLSNLFQILYDAASSGDTNTNKLLQFLVDKMITQQSKHQMYNVGRLRTSAFVDDVDEQETLDEPEKEDTDTVEELFQGYDIARDDQEDNMNGEYE